MKIATSVAVLRVETFQENAPNAAARVILSDPFTDGSEAVNVILDVAGHPNTIKDVI